MRGLALFVLIAVALPATASECSRVYRTAFESEIIQPNSPVAFLKQTVEAMGCKLIVVDTQANHDRRLDLLEKGKIDLVAEASYLSDRDSFALFSTPYRDEVTLLAVMKSKGDQHIRALTDIVRLRKRIISLDGGWLGPSVEVERERWRKLGLMVAYKDPLQALRDLRADRADVMLGTDLIFYQMLGNPDDVLILPFELYRDPVHIMFSKETVSEKEVEQFNVVLRQWRQQQREAVSK